MRNPQTKTETTERSTELVPLRATMDGMPDSQLDRLTPLAVALDRVGDRWSLLLVEALLDGSQRFNELTQRIGIAPNILTERLRRLERAGILVGQPYSDRPVRLAYRLTADGEELAGVLRLLAAWGASSSDGSEALRHALCGTPLEARWYCPTCARSAEDDEASALRFA
jgi:DNA-binding HxlR family transcriptional regulator